MTANLRSDGKAVDVVANKTGLKGDIVRFEGWNGVAMRDFTSGETVAIETTQREFVFNIGALTGAKGDVLYLTSAGALSNTASGNTPVIKITKAKNSDNVVWAKLLPQLS